MPGASAVVIYELQLDAVPDASSEDGWLEGPIPFPLGTSSSNQARRADAAGRATYFEAGPASVLLGTRNGPCRWHLAADDLNAALTRAEASGHDWLDGIVIDGVELIRCPPWGAPDTALGVVHLRFRGDGEEVGPSGSQRDGLADRDIVRHLAAFGARSLTADSAVKALLDELFVQVATLVPGRQRAFRIVFRTSVDALEKRMGPLYEAWPADRQWLWGLASATTEQQFPPDPTDEEPFTGTVPLSADWRALVLRDGAAFVGLRVHVRDSSDFLDTAEILVHSIYTDVFLLGVMQRLALFAYANRLSDAVGADLGTAHLAELEQGFARLRATLWWEKVTAHGIGNSLLLAFQDQNQLASLLERVRADLDDSSRLVMTASIRRRDAALGAITLLGLPFGLVFAVGSVLGEGVAVLVWCLGVSVAVVLALHTAPGVRDLSRDLVAQVLTQRVRTNRSTSAD